MSEESGEGLKKRPSRWRRVIALALIAGLAMAGVVYHRLYAWRGGWFAADRGRTEQGLPWIGAAVPELTIHEYLDYECPHCAAAHQDLRRALLFHQGDVRIVRHDYARMRCRAGSPGRPPVSCELVRAGICAADQGRFWRWNDAALSRQRPLTGQARADYPRAVAREIGLDAGEFEACLVDPRTVERAQAIYADARAAGVSETPSYVVDGVVMSEDEMAALLEQRF